MVDVCRTYGSVTVRRRESDGFFDATSMCKAFEPKRPCHYLGLSGSREYIKALADALKVPESALYQSSSGATTGGTWVHPRIAIDMARWLSPAFAVWMDGWVLERLADLASGQSTLAPKPAASPAYRSETQIHIANETDLHLQVVKYLRRFYPQAVFVAGLGELQDTEAKRLDAWGKGYAKGQPDLLILNGNRKYCGLAIEFKSPKAHALEPSEAQEKTLERLGRLGYLTVLSNDYDELCRGLAEYFREERFWCSCCSTAFGSERGLQAHRLRKRARELEREDEAVAAAASSGP